LSTAGFYSAADRQFGVSLNGQSNRYQSNRKRRCVRKFSGEDFFRNEVEVFVFAPHFIENDGVPVLVPLIGRNVVLARPGPQTDFLNEVETEHG